MRTYRMTNSPTRTTASGARERREARFERAREQRDEQQAAQGNEQWHARTVARLTFQARRF